MTATINELRIVRAYEDQKHRFLVVEKDPGRPTFSVYLCYRDGRVRRTALCELRGLATRRDANRALAKFLREQKIVRVDIADKEEEKNQ